MTLTFDTAPLIGPGTLDRLRVRADRAMTGPPDEIIEDRYLRRWHFLRGPALSLYLHLYVGGDPCAWPHDHPWPSLSLCLRGILAETGERRDGSRRTAKIYPGTLAFRPARFSHRLDLVSGPAVTLFLAGPRLRRWGWHLPGGWRPWHEVSGVDADGVTRMRFPS